MTNKSNYKTSRKYKCPYCELRATRGDLIDHVENTHQELIPEGYTAARSVFDSINGKDHGICMICKKPVYKWNDKINRYYNLCDNPSCKAKVREIALSRHLKVYNKPTLLNDPEQQMKMLANRRISGTYTFTDGKKMTYTGKYEHNALEFMDKVLNIPSTDIQTPGPTLEYEFEGKTHKWITDIFYIPANLIIEIKDGGSNPNTRSMQSYRDKQVAKEVMITNLGKFNYVRLTDNNFAQLLSIFADIKMGALEVDDTETVKKMRIHINEEVGGLPPQRPAEAYIVPYGMNNAFDSFAYGDSEINGLMTIDSEGNLLPMIESDFYNKFSTGPRLYFRDDDEKLDDIHNLILSDNTNKYDKLIFAETLLGHKLLKPEDIIMESDKFVYYDKEREDNICKLLENGAAINPTEITSDVIATDGVVSIHQNPNGYFATTPKDFFMASEYFNDLDSLERSDVVKLMNDVYAQNIEKRKEIL